MTKTAEYYRKRFKDNLFVVKAGGRIVEDKDSRAGLISDIRELTESGIKVVLIYGGGKAIDRALGEAGITSRKENGIRLTCGRDMRIIQSVMSGDLTYTLAAEMDAAGLSGLPLALVPPGWLELSFPKRDPEYQNFDADISGANEPAIKAALSGTGFISCPCLTVAGGHGVNINADTVATKIATGIKADKLIFLSDVDGVLVEGKVAPTVTDRTIPELIEKGVVEGGMRVKLESCLHALNAGVKRIHLINGFRKNALKNEILEAEGPGTMILKSTDETHYIREEIGRQDNT